MGALRCVEKLGLKEDLSVEARRSFWSDAMDRLVQALLRLTNTSQLQDTPSARTALAQEGGGDIALVIEGVFEVLGKFMIHREQLLPNREMNGHVVDNHVKDVATVTHPWVKLLLSTPMHASRWWHLILQHIKETRRHASRKDVAWEGVWSALYRPFLTDVLLHPKLILLSETTRVTTFLPHMVCLLCEAPVMSALPRFRTLSIKSTPKDDTLQRMDNLDIPIAILQMLLQTPLEHIALDGVGYWMVKEGILQHPCFSNHVTHRQASEISGSDAVRVMTLQFLLQSSLHSIDTTAPSCHAIVPAFALLELVAEVLAFVPRGTTEVVWMVMLTCTYQLHHQTRHVHGGGGDAMVQLLFELLLWCVPGMEGDEAFDMGKEAEATCRGVFRVVWPLLVPSLVYIVTASRFASVEAGIVGIARRLLAHGEAFDKSTSEEKSLALPESVKAMSFTGRFAFVLYVGERAHAYYSASSMQENRIRLSYVLANVDHAISRRKSLSETQWLDTLFRLSPMILCPDALLNGGALKLLASLMSIAPRSASAWYGFVLYLYLLPKIARKTSKEALCSVLSWMPNLLKPSVMDSIGTAMSHQLLQLIRTFESHTSLHVTLLTRLWQASPRIAYPALRQSLGRLLVDPAQSLASSADQCAVALALRQVCREGVAGSQVKAYDVLSLLSKYLSWMTTPGESTRRSAASLAFCIEALKALCDVGGEGLDPRAVWNVLFAPGKGAFQHLMRMENERQNSSVVLVSALCDFLTVFRQIDRGRAVACFIFACIIDSRRIDTQEEGRALYEMVVRKAWHVSLSEDTTISPKGLDAMAVFVRHADRSDMDQTYILSHVVSKTTMEMLSTRSCLFSSMVGFVRACIEFELVHVHQRRKAKTVIGQGQLKEVGGVPGDKSTPMTMRMHAMQTQFRHRMMNKQSLTMARTNLSRR